MSSLNPHSILKIQELNIGYKDKKRVHTIQSDISFNLQKGSLVAVLGRNGIGKSTLLRTLTKVQSPLSGSVFINGKDIQQYDFKELSKKVSVVLTERLPESQLTVFELVALGRQPYTNWVGKLSDEDVAKVHWALNQTDCQEFAQKHFYELSDGQLQRVMIARALAQDTEIIVLDEPTAHLDMHHTIKIFQLLEKLVKETRKTIILSSHQVNLAIQYADQLILMTEKEITCGAREELKESEAFDQLFPSEILNFDTNLEQFVIRKNS